MLVSILSAIFLTPIIWESKHLPMLLPLTLAVAIVYKTLKLDDLRILPIAAGLLWITILAAMAGITLAIYIILYLFS